MVAGLASTGANPFLADFLVSFHGTVLETGARYDGSKVHLAAPGVLLPQLRLGRKADFSPLFRWFPRYFPFYAPSFGVTLHTIHGLFPFLGPVLTCSFSFLACER